MTQPVLCYLADDQLYAVKGRQALPAGLIAEVVAGSLGQLMGLPIPDFAVADFSRQLADASADASLRSTLNIGSNFASRWQEAADPITMPSLGMHPPALLAKIFVFDHWVMNGDRTLSEHGGNPNLFVKLDTNELIVIAHNLAFSQRYNPEELQFHACRDAWSYMKKSSAFLSECRDLLSQAIQQLTHIFSDLPDQWTEQESDLLIRIDDSLRRFEDTEFWEQLA